MTAPPRSIRLLPWGWAAAVGWSAWFAIRIWSDYDTLLMIGPGPALLLWGAPVVLLLLLPTWALLRKWTGRWAVMPAVFLAGWIALIALPAPPQPVEYTMAGQTDTLTTVTGYFWFVMLLVSAGPVGLSLAMLISVLRARPAAD